jgi:hypothetical protein
MSYESNYAEISTPNDDEDDMLSDADLRRSSGRSLLIAIAVGIVSIVAAALVVLYG